MDGDHDEARSSHTSYLRIDDDRIACSRSPRDVAGTPPSAPSVAWPSPPAVPSTAWPSLPSAPSAAWPSPGRASQRSPSSIAEMAPIPAPLFPPWAVVRGRRIDGRRLET